MGHGKLWETLAAGRPEFGNPAVFDNHVDESTWVSFTVTLNDPTFFSLIEAFSGKYARSRDFAFRTVRSFRAIDRLRGNTRTFRTLIPAYIPAWRSAVVGARWTIIDQKPSICWAL